jgi:hypothetical protein
VADAVRRYEWTEAFNGVVALAVMAGLAARELFRVSHVIVGPDEVVVRQPDGGIWRLPVHEIHAVRHGREAGELQITTPSGPRMIASGVLRGREPAEQVLRLIADAKGLDRDALESGHAG